MDDDAGCGRPTQRPGEHTAVLFVCTGNTCRSPLAAAAAGALGIRASSAGIEASPDRPASHGALAAAHDVGLDLGGHRSRRLTGADIAEARLVLTMTAAQAAAVLERWPGAAGKVARLDPSADVEDPYGGDAARYTATAAHIVASVGARFERSG